MHTFLPHFHSQSLNIISKIALLHTHTCMHKNWRTFKLNMLLKKTHSSTQTHAYSQLDVLSNSTQFKKTQSCTHTYIHTNWRTFKLWTSFEWIHSHVHTQVHIHEYILIYLLCTSIDKLFTHIMDIVQTHNDTYTGTICTQSERSHTPTQHSDRRPCSDTRIHILTYTRKNTHTQLFLSLTKTNKSVDIFSLFINSAYFYCLKIIRYFKERKTINFIISLWQAIGHITYCGSNHQ